jgi:hypothetical protein
MCAVTLVKKFAILCHRWMGVAFCLLFAWWFLSGIFMMYWDYPDVSASNRLERAQPIDRSKIQISAREAWSKLGEKGEAGGVALAMFDARPVYRFSSGKTVYADDGSTQDEYPDDLLLRMAASWTSQPAQSAKKEEITQPEQWTIGVRNRLPLFKYSFPDGEQVYVSPHDGEVVQYTTTGSRVGAYLGPIPHWLYFTPLRVRTELWSNVIIYASGIGTVMALLGLTVGVWMVSPSRKYRFEGAPTSVPYTGQKRLHMILGLFFGIVTCTWAFSGMLSMDPPFLNSDPKGAVLGNSGLSASAKIQSALHPGRFRFSDYDGKTPQQALEQLNGLAVKELDFTSFDGQPLYLATIGRLETRVIPVAGNPRAAFDQDRIFQMVAHAAEPVKIVEQRLMTRYDAYYLDRHGRRPLPVLFVKLDDTEHTQLYIDQRTGRTVEEHSDSDSFIERWLYHGLHSLDFPWLYNYRPAWDIVVLTLMLGGLSLSITAVIIGWQLLRRKLVHRPEVR